ncbi:mechanosensitive ion channel [bacterium]|nr:mechanosensitive ion channel [bacterium]
MEELSNISSIYRIILIIALLAAAHFVVLLIRRFSEKILTARLSTSFSKVKSIVSLVSSIVVFVLYFAALGLLLKEVGVSLTAYFASASIVGLAVGFGSQGFVQDVVTGITILFSDIFDVGDMVEISGQSGIVKSIGMRFTIITNSMGAQVYIPNRTIANVINYPSGYVRCLADITLSRDPELAKRMEEAIPSLIHSMREQFPGILLTDPSLEGKHITSSGREFLRTKFRLWPGRTGLIETTFKQEVLQMLKEIDPSYADWMIAVNYEVEEKPISLPLRTRKKALYKTA